VGSRGTPSRSNHELNDPHEQHKTKLADSSLGLRSTYLPHPPYLPYLSFAACAV